MYHKLTREKPFMMLMDNSYLYLLIKYEPIMRNKMLSLVIAIIATIDRDIDYINDETYIRLLSKFSGLTEGFIKKHFNTAEMIAFNEQKMEEVGY